MDGRFTVKGADAGLALWHCITSSFPLTKVQFPVQATHRLFLQSHHYFSLRHSSFLSLSPLVMSIGSATWPDRKAIAIVWRAMSKMGFEVMGFVVGVQEEK